jgi:predicted transcriptional regulator
MRHAAAARGIPPPLELSCLNALWSLEEGSVKDVREVLANSRPLAYTTVMTMLERLTRRGLLTRRKAGRAWIYAPAVARDDLRRLALKEFLDSYFESSPEQLLRFLATSPTLSPAPAGTLSSGLDPALL